MEYIPFALEDGSKYSREVLASLNSIGDYVGDPVRICRSDLCEFTVQTATNL
jgi:hypothetical protein